MAQDHYISQTYLRRWLPPVENRLRAIKKSDLRQFRPGTHSVCTTKEGNTNPFLPDERLIEKLIEPLERGYGRALERISEGKPDVACISVLAGFIVYVEACSPTAVRVAREWMEPVLERRARLVDPPPGPPELRGQTIRQLIDDGDVGVEVDPNYPQAVGAACLDEVAITLGNSHWEVLTNEHSDSPFFTSDYPVALESTGTSAITSRVVPLSPNVAVRIRTLTTEREALADPTFANCRIVLRTAKRDQVREVNKLIVRAAENIVFHRDEAPWVPAFVRKHAGYRMVARTDTFPAPGGGRYEVFVRRIGRSDGGEHYSAGAGY